MQYKWTVLTVTTIGVLMSGIDSRIVVIGLPAVASSLHADAEQAIWFTQAYFIGSTAALLFLGRVSDMVGRVRVYTLGFTVFTAGSFLTSLSPTPDFFIASRIFQGLGSAALFSNSTAIITDAFPRQELGKALGINSVATRTGTMLGLTVSGIILAFFNWPALFLVNVPVGIFGTFWARKRLHDQGTSEKAVPMDWLGFASFTTFVAFLLLALTFGAYGMATSDLVVSCSVIAGTCLFTFALAERGNPNPLFELGLLRIREFAGGVLAQFVNAISWGAFTLLVSLYLQLVKGFSPLQAGVAIVPFDVSLLLIGIVSGRLSDSHGPRILATSGLAVFTLALVGMSTLNAGSTYAPLLACLILGGAGMGLFISPNIKSIMSSVPPQRRGVAAGARATLFNIGFALSFNIVILVLVAYLPYGLISNIISSGGGAIPSARDLSAFAMSLDHVYVVLAAINTVAILPSWLRGR